MTSSAIIKWVPPVRRHWAGSIGDFQARPWDFEGDYDETYPARTPPPEIALEAIHRTMLDRIHAPRGRRREWKSIAILVAVVLIELMVVFAFMSSVWLRYSRGLS